MVRQRSTDMNEMGSASNAAEHAVMLSEMSKAACECTSASLYGPAGLLTNGMLHPAVDYDYDDNTTMTDFCPAGATLVPSGTFPYISNGGNLTGLARTLGFDVSPVTGHTFAFAANTSVVRCYIRSSLASLIIDLGSGSPGPGTESQTGCLARSVSNRKQARGSAWVSSAMRCPA